MSAGPRGGARGQIHRRDFNYCDRWCERCAFTSRCRNFTMGRAMERHARRTDRDNEAFWQAMDKACGDALGDVTRQAESLARSESGDDEDDNAEREAVAALGREMDERDRAVRAHPLASLAEQYLWDAHRWLERRRGRVAEAIADAVDVIAWYHMFISMKLSRALSGLMDEDDVDYEEAADDDGVPFPKDCDGSAKIAVIAIERSFAAWSLVRDRSAAKLERQAAVKRMGLLLRLRTLAEQAFPDARKFHRPGFDDAGSRD